MHRVRIQKAATAGGVRLAAVARVAACSSSGSGSGGSSSSASASASAKSSAPAAVSGTLNASGSTFQTTFQQAAIQAIKSTEPNLTVNYGGGGSGKGRTDLASGVVNFAGSDSPIPAAEKAGFKGATILYFPVVIGPIAISYNLSGVKNLKLDGPTIAKIFDGTIKTWNDPAIKALNSGASLPSTAITIARRSDSSGTTQNFSEFLVKSAPGVWKLGTSSTINWQSNRSGGSGRGQPGHRGVQPDLQRDLGPGRQLLPGDLPVLGPGERRPVQLDHDRQPQGLPRLPTGGGPEAAARAEL